MSRAFTFPWSFLLLILIFVGKSCSLPNSFSRTIGTGSQNVTVDFELFPIRSPNFRVIVQQCSGHFEAIEVSCGRTYLGYVRGQSGAMAAALLRADGSLLARIFFENGVEWVSSNSGFSIRGDAQWTPHLSTTTVAPSTSSSVLSVAEVGIDSSYGHYVASGSKVFSTLEMVEFSIMATNIPFLRDASILHKIGTVLIRTCQSCDPYSNTDIKVQLNTVKKQWNTDITNVVGNTHNLALLVNPGAGGGFASVGSIGTSDAYSVNGGECNGDFSVVWREQAGHNWGSISYEGDRQSEGPTIMSGNQLSRFSSVELVEILIYKFKFSFPIISYPPRANIDVVESQGLNSVVINALANDVDANVKTLKLVSAQNPSTMNSTIQVLNNQLVFTPSLEASLSGDYFSYEIKNDQSKTATGYVIVRPNALIAWWKMTEQTIEDSSGRGADGNISGSITWDKGNNAINFGGAGMVSFGTKPSLSGTTSFTISAWVRVPQTASKRQVILQQRSLESSNTNGCNGEYQFYLYNGKPSFFIYGDGAFQFGSDTSDNQFSAPVAVNDDKWHHVVAVRNNTEGYIYIDGNLSTSTTSDKARNLDGNISVFMGWEGRAYPGWDAFFTGSLMLVRLYNRALSSDEISYLNTRPEALVGWWKMHALSGFTVKDSSITRAPGTIIGSASWEQDGGLTFRGAGKVSFGTKPSLNGKTSFSIHAWVKIPKHTTSKGTIIQQRSSSDSTTNGYNGEYLLYIDDGEPNFTVYGDGKYQFHMAASKRINDGQWHHLIAARDGEYGYIYLDGMLSASIYGTPVKSLDGRIPVFIGCDARYNNSFLIGSLKGVKIYNQLVLLNEVNNLQVESQGLQKLTRNNNFQKI